MTRKSLGNLVRMWPRGGDTRHVGFVGWPDDEDAAVEFSYSTICREYGDEGTWETEFESDPPPHLCRNCARICRNVAEEADDD